MNVDDPVIRRYLDQLRGALESTSIGAEEQREILLEIESHVLEARRTGVSPAETLKRLGPADELSQGFEMELMLRTRSSRQPVMRWIMQGLTILATLLLIFLLGTTGLALLCGGAAAVVAGVVGPFLPPQWMDPTLRPGVPQLVVLLVGVTLGGVGLLLLRILRLNLRLLIATIRGTLPR